MQVAWCKGLKKVLPQYIGSKMIWITQENMHPISSVVKHVCFSCTLSQNLLAICLETYNDQCYIYSYRIKYRKILFYFNEAYH